MIELEELYQDFLNFSKLHSWYKKLDFKGTTFYFYQEYGIQQRLLINPIKDKDKLHWHFSRFEPKDKKYYITKCGPFLRGDPNFHIIKSDNQLIFDDWFLKNYPEYYYKYQTDDYFERYDIEKIVAESERDKYWETTKIAFLKDKKIIITI